MKTFSIMDGAGTGFYNMAADISMAELVEARGAKAVFRTYMWSPHCLSIGRFQKPEREADVERLLKDGYHIVRRPTGGRAVWHGHELTYSIAASRHASSDPGSFSRAVAGLLVFALEQCGVPCVINTDSRETFSAVRGHNPCFTSHGEHEITTRDGRKLVGTARALIRGVFLEHGSIVFANQQPLAAKYLPGTVSPRHRTKAALMLEAGVGSVGEHNPALRREDLAQVLHGEFARFVSEKPLLMESRMLPGIMERANERQGSVEAHRKA